MWVGYSKFIENNYRFVDPVSIGVAHRQNGPFGNFPLRLFIVGIRWVEHFRRKDEIGEFLLIFYDKLLLYRDFVVEFLKNISFK